MKISGVVIQERNISVKTDDEFEASYKGKKIYVSSNHGHGKPSLSHLIRFNIDVIDDKTGLYDVMTVQDHHNIVDAIRSALVGAKLLNLGWNR